MTVRAELEPGDRVPEHRPTSRATGLGENARRVPARDPPRFVYAGVIENADGNGTCQDAGSPTERSSLDRKL